MRTRAKTSIFSPVHPLFHIPPNSAPSSPSSHPQIVILISSNLEIPPLSVAPATDMQPLPVLLLFIFLPEWGSEIDLTQLSACLEPSSPHSLALPQDHLSSHPFCKPPLWQPAPTPSSAVSLLALNPDIHLPGSARSTPQRP